MSATWQVLDLGTADYREVWARQLALVEQRQIGQAPDTLILVEHPHVFTLGRRRDSQQNVLAPGDVPVIEIERGGDVRVDRRVTRELIVRVRARALQ